MVNLTCQDIDTNRNEREENPMSQCNLDHSLADVKKKLDEQTPFLPEQMVSQLKQFLNETIEQSTLNEVFHLLKKYDLANQEERQERETKLTKLMNAQ